MVRVVRISPAPAGIALTHDGKLLVAAAINSAVVLDVARMTAGAEDPILGTFSNQEGTCLQCIYINVTPDDKLLFVSDEGADVIIVIDLERARANGFKAAAITGSIPVGGSPIALTFSPDGKWLYSTSESGSPAWNWPRACKPGGAPLTPEQVTARKVDMEARIAALEALQSGASEKGVARLQQQIDSLKSIIGSLSGVPLANPEGAVVVMM
jgi:DNA-binding beta-propeller fold protein YncE